MKIRFSVFAASLIIALAVMWTSTATAQVPWSISHQGVLVDDSGDPVTGEHELTFTLYDNGTGGAIVWQGTVTATLSDVGFFSVILGGQSNPMDPAVFTGDSRWLTMSVDNGPEMTPRLEITSVPYAVLAGRASEVASGGVTTGALASDAVTSDKVANLSWDKLIDVPPGLDDGDDDTLGGLSCLTGDQAEWNGSQWICSAPPTPYTDADARAAMGPVGDTNSYNHTRYTDAEAVAAMGTRSNSNPLNHDRANYSAGNGLTLSGNTFNADPRGVTYERWGRSDCPSGAQLVYSGFPVSGAHNHTGGISSLHCMHGNPTWPAGLNDGNQNGALLYGTEFQTSGYGISALNGHHDDDGSCAVCLQPDADNEIMIPGTISCPSGWSVEYTGYIMGTHYTQSSTHEAACVDVNATAGIRPTNNNGNLWYPTETECGSLPCPPYVQDREVGCAVCTR